MTWLLTPRIRAKTLLRWALIVLALYAGCTGCWVAYSLAPVHIQQQSQDVVRSISTQLGVTEIPSPGGDDLSVRHGPTSSSRSPSGFAPGLPSTTSGGSGSGVPSSTRLTSSSTSPLTSPTIVVPPKPELPTSSSTTLPLTCPDPLPVPLPPELVPCLDGLSAPEAPQLPTSSTVGTPVQSPGGDNTTP